MEIHYIYHSSFLAECSSCSLLFDYFRGYIPVIPPEKPLYVFASHFHQDHFSAGIFDLALKYHDVTFILSSDIKEHGRLERNIIDEFGIRYEGGDTGNPQGKIVLLGPDETWSDGVIRVETLRSNDEGVAFIISAPETIYYAGDLNNWYWDEEPDSLELVDAYHKEMEKIRGRHFEIAFVPLDPRLGEHAKDGIMDFLAAADADLVFPMHMWDDYDIIDRFYNAPETKPYRDKIVPRIFY